MDRKAKIVATIGPATKSIDGIRGLILAGMNVARLNFSHGLLEDHLKVINILRDLSSEYNKPVAILQDLQGPKIRIGDLPDGPISIAKNDLLRIKITEEGDSHTPAELGVDFTIPIPSMKSTLCEGNRILLDDGNLEMVVEDCHDDLIRVRVVLGGVLKPHKGFNLPGIAINIPGFTNKDKQDLSFGLDAHVDLLAVSFVRTSKDIHVVRESIRNTHPDQIGLPIIAKIERPEALENLNSILQSADGVMVARGDLGVEMNPAEVPVAQKNIISAANRQGKLVITATQMLDSMIHNPRPTRAEAADVANAIFDGSDAVMLSGETAAGMYPIESVQMMASIIDHAEKHYQEWSICTANTDLDTEDDAVAITSAAYEIARDRNVVAITVFTHSGRTARLMSKMRPQVPILAFTPSEETYQRMSLYWGVEPALIDIANSVDTMIGMVDQALMKKSGYSPGQQVVLISSYPVMRMRAPNFALLHTIGQN